MKVHNMNIIFVYKTIKTSSCKQQNKEHKDEAKISEWALGLDQ